MESMLSRKYALSGKNQANTRKNLVEATCRGSRARRRNP